MISDIELTDEQIKHISGGAVHPHWGHHWGFGFGSHWGYAAPAGYGYGYPVTQIAVETPQVALVPVATTEGYQVAAAPVTAVC